jgi:capsular polysaccharide biosynthesis protein
MIEEEYKQVTRDHETALQFYNTLLTKMNESTMATALEHRQQGEQFRVMDAPNLPDEPTFPDRRIFAGGGLAFGLFLGLLLAALLEYRDTSVRNERDIWAFTKLPTLAIISYISDLDHPDKAGKRFKLFSRTPKPIESVRG